jgi:hypothetical protein
MSANRFDEGYSEDTRSQSGGDMAMQSDFRAPEDGLQPDSPLALPDWVVALSESERSGRRLCHDIIAICTNIAQSSRMPYCDPSGHRR